MGRKEKVSLAVAAAFGFTGLCWAVEVLASEPPAEPSQIITGAVASRTGIFVSTETPTPKPSLTPTPESSSTTAPTKTRLPVGGGGNPLAGIPREKPTPTPTPKNKETLSIINAKNSGPEKEYLISPVDGQVYRLGPGETGWFRAGKQPHQKVDVAVSFVQARSKGLDNIIVGYYSNQQAGQIIDAWHQSNFKNMRSRFLGELTPTDPATTNSSGYIDRYFPNGGNGSTEWYAAAVINRTDGTITFTIQSKDKPPSCQGKESFSFWENLPNLPPDKKILWGTCDEKLKPKGFTFVYPDGQNHREVMTDLRRQQILASRQSVRIT